MNNTTDHIFTPKDASLESRIEAYRHVYEAWLTAEASCTYLNDDEWGASLEDKDEVERALDISIRSLYMSSDAFTREELAEAKRAHLIQSHEAQDIIANQCQGEMRSVREESSHASDSSEQSQTR